MALMFVFTTSNAFANSATVSDVAATGNANNNQTFEAGDRAFPIGIGVNYPQLPGYFGDNNKPGHQFISLDLLMMYDNEWNVAKAKMMLAGSGFDVNANIAPLAKMVKSENYSKSIICVKKAFDTSKFEVTQLAIGTVNSTNKEAISAHDLAKAIVLASKYGATHIQFLGEGTNTELSSTGWGIGLSYTKASSDSISSGGTGYSTGWSGYNNLPWQQFIILKVVDPNAVAEVEVVVEEEVVVAATPVVDTQVDKAVKAKVAKQTGNHMNN
ncbi:MAG: hypothetical protein DRI84_07475 [Bacteroidetes bacterium]|nr:MAG: hypothetical protein DRI84_07475 [Bacteroidota bacterium]